MKERNQVILVLGLMVLMMSTMPFLFMWGEADWERVETACNDNPDCWIIVDDFSASKDIIILLGILLPIIVVVGLFIAYFPKKKEVDLNG